MIHSLVYVSTATLPFSDEEVEALARQSARRNVTLSITGYLCYSHGRFLQYLEGPPEALTVLMADIRADVRHRIDNEVAFPAVEERRFPDWSMRSIDEQQREAASLDGLLESVVSNMTEPVLEPNMRALTVTMVQDMIGIIASRRDALGA